MPTPGNIKEKSTSEQKRAKIKQNEFPKAKKNTLMLVFTFESQKKKRRIYNRCLAEELEPLRANKINLIWSDRSQEKPASAQLSQLKDRC